LAEKDVTQMRNGLFRAIALAGGAVVVLACSTPTLAVNQASRGRANTSAPRELVYVASADSGPVTAYASGSRGTVGPALTVADPNNPNTVWDPWGVAFDTSGHLYVQSFLSDATTFVFPPIANGTTTPSRIFRAQGPDNQAIAVDAKGFAYIAGGETFEAIDVVRPGARGRPADLYSVPVARTIPLDEGFNPWADILTVNTKNQVLAAVARPQGNAIEIFDGGSRGSQRPVRVISGSRTDLGSCPAAPSRCDEVSITFSPLTGLIYAAVSDGRRTHIGVFAGNASGNARPIRTIEGPATRLDRKAITGIAVSRRSGVIYVMAKTGSEFGAGRVIAYGRRAHGDSAPLRTFTDRISHFANALGLAILTVARRR
jgi:hypothetical protein